MNNISVEHSMRWIAAILVMMAVVRALAQTPAGRKPAFEVASIKRNTSGGGVLSLETTKGRFVATNLTVRLLLRYAYNANMPESELLRGPLIFGDSAGIQVIGGPSWIQTDHFDIEAKPAGDHTISQSEMQFMVQSLLEDRFQLKVHREMREVPTFDLVVVKAGKLRTSDESSLPLQGMPPQPRGMLRTFVMGKPPVDRTPLVETMYGRGVSMSNLVLQLESWARRPVTDKTNLTGLFDIHLEFSPAASRPTTDGAADPSGPSIFTAIEQELGLKLESAKGPVEVLVIDSVSKPTEN